MSTRPRATTFSPSLCSSEVGHQGINPGRRAHIGSMIAIVGLLIGIGKLVRRIT